jgi:hypothetical protein
MQPPAASRQPPVVAQEERTNSVPSHASSFCVLRFRNVHAHRKGKKKKQEHRSERESTVALISTPPSDAEFSLARQSPDPAKSSFFSNSAYQGQHPSFLR